MSHKSKKQLIHVGARVRVADPQLSGAERWEQARPGVVLEVKENGAEVAMDDVSSMFVLWADLDLAVRPRGRVLEIPLSEIRPSRWQYRRAFDPGALAELAASIGEHGLINSILMFRIESSRFELIAGERRVRAAWALALAEVRGVKLAKTIPIAASLEFWDQLEDLAGEAGAQPIRAEVREGDPEGFQVIALIENLQREGVSAIDEAEALEQLMICNEWTQTELARRLGKSGPYISQRLGLLDLDEGAREAARAGDISFTTARALGGLPDAVQMPMAEVIKGKLEGDDPATSRQVSVLVGAARRFFDPALWIPDPEQPIAPAHRNRYRMIAYHIEYAINHDPERVQMAIGELSCPALELLGRKRKTIVDRYNFALLVLNALTGAKESEIAAFWGPLATLQGLTCENCQFGPVPAPEVPAGSQGLTRCDRWDSQEVKTCEKWIGPADPVVLFVHWQIQRAIDETEDHALDALGAAGLDGEERYPSFDDMQQQIGELEDPAPALLKMAEIKGYHPSKMGPAWFSDIAGYSRAVVLAAERLARERVGSEERERERYLGPIREYWKRQPGAGGLGGPFLLVHWQAQPCRLCRHYRADVLEDLGVPCGFAIEPLEHVYMTDQKIAPDMSLLIREDGAMIPRCEGFQRAELGAAEWKPIPGLSFPADESGILDAQGWLARLATGSGNWHRRGGVIPGPLSWVPYERKKRIEADNGALMEWIAARWAELGFSAIGRLLSMAAYESKAGENYSGPFFLMDPTTGELEKWCNVPFGVLLGTAEANNFPKRWPRPWESEPAGDG